MRPHDAKELGERLLVEDDHVERARLDAPFTKAVFDRIDRKSLVVFLPRKPLFLRSGRDPTVLDEARCRVVVETTHPEYVHRVPPPC